MEKTLDLKLSGVKELSKVELKNMEAGSFLLAIVAGAVVIGALFAGKWLADQLCNCDEI